jgi:hypothetical protein
MTKYGPDPEDCRATGAVAIIDASDVRTGLEQRSPKWKPAGYTTLPVGNRAALHLVADNSGGANCTLRNFVAGYQQPANSPDMSGLERDIQNAATGGQVISMGILPVYGNPALRPGVPDQIQMVAYGSGGYALNCTVYNQPQGGYTCTQRDIWWTFLTSLVGRS